MFSTSDTIVAVATPPGRGGIGVVRISGPQAHSIALSLVDRRTPLQPRYATLAEIHLPAASSPGTPIAVEREPGHRDAIDQAIVIYFPSPHSYTGEEIVEISAHGSPVVLHAIVAAAIGQGARPAEPGEFTLRAFLNGRIDLTQAEAIADLVDAVTPLQARAAFDQLHGTLTRTIGTIDAALFALVARLEASVDFPDEGYHFIDPTAVASAIDEIVSQIEALLSDARRGRLLREGLEVAIVGRPNVGKSSLFNALVGSARAIVTEEPGTTRDLVTELVDLDGLRVTLVDTAGLRDAADRAEMEGVRRSRQAVDAADLTIVVADQSVPLDEEAGAAIGKKRLLVASKADLPAKWSRDDAVAVSALTGSGMALLRRRIAAALDVDYHADRPAMTNVRHVALLERAGQALKSARTAAQDLALSEEFVLADLQIARDALEEVTGRRAPEDVLAHIFERFCVGK